MLCSSTVLARNASSILAHISRLPAELASHPLLFTLSTNAPAPSLPSLAAAVSSFSSFGSVGCLSAQTHPDAPALVACLLAFFREEYSVPFLTDIPGRPETRVGRCHSMWRAGEERIQGGEVELTEDVEWEIENSPRLCFFCVLFGFGIGVAVEVAESSASRSTGRSRKFSSVSLCWSIEISGGPVSLGGWTMYNVLYPLRPLGPLLRIVTREVRPALRLVVATRNFGIDERTRLLARWLEGLSAFLLGI